MLLDEEPEEVPSTSQPCGRGELWSCTPLLRVSSGPDREKRGSAHPGHAESHGTLHCRVSEGSSIKSGA